MLCVLAGICAGELFFMLRSDAKLPNELLGTLAAVAYPISMWKLGLSGSLLVTGALLVALLVWYVFFMRARVGDVGVSVFSARHTRACCFRALFFVTHVAAWHLGWRSRMRRFL